MTDVVLARLLGKAMALAIEIRDGDRPAHHAVLVVVALNDCLEHVARDDLAATGIPFDSMNYRELLDWLDANNR
jgi:hypothetical protein